MTSHTAEASSIHEPIGSPSGPGLWHHKGLQLPAYIQHVAHHLIGQGHSESEAIEMAVGIVKNWAAGSDGHGNRTHPDVQAAAAKAISEWEALKSGAGKARRSAVTVTQRAEMSTQDINDLPDSDFGYIEPGGSKDSGGKTVPRSLRHFPLNDAPHVRDALSRAPQSPFGKKAMPKIKAAARKFGIDYDPDRDGDDDLSKAGDTDHDYAGASRAARWDWEPRPFPLEDVRILTRAEGYGSGTVVEAYATVFEQPAEIKDGQGHYMEVIDRSAFDQTLARLQRQPGGIARQVKVLYNHGKTAEGLPAPEFQVPIGVPVEIRPEARGLLTRTDFDASDPFTERILSKVRSGAINAYSFVGGIMRSNPDLRGPGDRYRARNGTLQTVRRMSLGLREYGPVLWPAYTGAEILGVRMSIPGSPFQEEPASPEHEEYVPDMEGDGTGGAPEDVTSARYHQHALYRLRSEEIRERLGLAW